MDQTPAVCKIRRCHGQPLVSSQPTGQENQRPGWAEAAACSPLIMIFIGVQLHLQCCRFCCGAKESVHAVALCTCPHSHLAFLPDEVPTERGVRSLRHAVSSGWLSVLYNYSVSRPVVSASSSSSRPLITCSLRL